MHTRKSRALVAACKWFGRDYAPASVMFFDVLKRQDNARTKEASLRLDSLADALCDLACSDATRWSEDRQFVADHGGDE